MQPRGRAPGTSCRAEQAGYRGTVLHGSTRVTTWSGPAWRSRGAGRQGAAVPWHEVSATRGGRGPESADGRGLQVAWESEGASCVAPAANPR